VLKPSLLPAPAQAQAQVQVQVQEKGKPPVMIPNAIFREKPRPLRWALWRARRMPSEQSACPLQVCNQVLLLHGLSQPQLLPVEAIRTLSLILILPSRTNGKRVDEETALALQALPRARNKAGSLMMSRPLLAANDEVQGDTAELVELADPLEGTQMVLAVLSV